MDHWIWNLALAIYLNVARVPEEPGSREDTR